MNRLRSYLRTVRAILRIIQRIHRQEQQSRGIGIYVDKRIRLNVQRPMRPGGEELPFSNVEIR